MPVHVWFRVMPRIIAMAGAVPQATKMKKESVHALAMKDSLETNASWLTVNLQKLLATAEVSLLTKPSTAIVLAPVTGSRIPMVRLVPVIVARWSAHHLVFATQAEPTIGQTDSAQKQMEHRILMAHARILRDSQQIGPDRNASKSLETATITQAFASHPTSNKSKGPTIL